MRMHTSHGFLPPLSTTNHEVGETQGNDNETVNDRYRGNLRGHHRGKSQPSPSDSPRHVAILDTPSRKKKEEPLVTTDTTMTITMAIAMMKLQQCTTVAERDSGMSPCGTTGVRGKK